MKRIITVMTHQPPPLLPYQTPSRTTPNVGTRAAMVSWVVPIPAVALLCAIPAQFYDALPLACGSVALLIIGIISGAVALATMRRYGRSGILRPAIVGLCLNLAILLFLVFMVIMFLFYSRPPM